MGSGPSTPGIKLMTNYEAIHGMPRRVVKGSSEQSSLDSPNHKTSTTEVNSRQIVSDKAAAFQSNGTSDSNTVGMRNTVTTHDTGPKKIDPKQGDTNQTDKTMKASTAVHDTAITNVNSKSQNKTQDGTSVSDAGSLRETENLKVAVKQEDDSQSNLDISTQSISVDGGDAESKGSESVKKVLTEQEIEEKFKELTEKYEKKFSQMSTIPPRDLEQEGAPFTKEFRQCMLMAAQSYFKLKLGQVPYPTIQKYRNTVGEILMKHNIFKLMCDVGADTLKRKDYISENFKMVNEVWLPLSNILLTFLNYTDCKNETKMAVAEHPDLLPLLVQVLIDWCKMSQENSLTERQEKMLKWTLSICHNCAAMEENVPRLRDMGLIKAILPYLDSSNVQIRLSSIATLADLVNEEEAELLNANVSIFKFILKKIDQALKTENHKDAGWSAEELVRAVRQLARNDANKKILVNEGTLPLLVKMLEVGNEAETEEALHCMWALSFDDDNKAKMAHEPGLVEKVYSKFCSSAGSKKHTCHGILWSLREELLSSGQCKHIGEEISKKKSQAVIKPGVGSAVEETQHAGTTTKYNGHVMISYQWGNQEVIKQITQELRAHGIPVWIDIDYMGDSTLQAMAQAVEESFIVIIAMSQKYKDSPNTRAEAEYAFQQRKKIIPLIMQRGYRPDGWLGLILGSKLFYDFSGKYSFESRMDGLLKAINLLAGRDSTDCGEQALVPSKAGALAGAKPMTLSPLTPVAHPPPPRHPQPPQVDEEAVKTWTSADVTKWLTKYKLENSSLQNLNGEEILFLHNLRYEAPEFFFSCLEKKLQISSLLDLANTTKALNDLKL